MIKWRQAALQYPCETCGAVLGAKCISVGGVRKYEIHQYRTDRAKANGWRVIGDDDGPGPGPDGAGARQEHE